MKLSRSGLPRGSVELSDEEAGDYYVVENTPPGAAIEGRNIVFENGQTIKFVEIYIQHDTRYEKVWDEENKIYTDEWFKLQISQIETPVTYEYDIELTLTIVYG